MESEIFTVGGGATKVRRASAYFRDRRGRGYKFCARCFVVDDERLFDAGNGAEAAELATRVKLSVGRVRESPTFLVGEVDGSKRKRFERMLEQQNRTLSKRLLKDAVEDLKQISCRLTMPEGFAEAAATRFQIFHAHNDFRKLKIPSSARSVLVHAMASLFLEMERWRIKRGNFSAEVEATSKGDSPEHVANSDVLTAIEAQRAWFSARATKQT